MLWLVVGWTLASQGLGESFQTKFLSLLASIWKKNNLNYPVFEKKVFAL